MFYNSIDVLFQTFTLVWSAEDFVLLSITSDVNLVDSSDNFVSVCKNASDFACSSI